MHMYTWACLGGVDFEEEDQDTDQVKHVAGESEDVHGWDDKERGGLVLERESETR